MKVFAAVTCVLLATHTFAVHLQLTRGQKSFLKLVAKELEKPLDLCPICIQFTDQTIDILLNIILNSGIIGSCEILCTALEEKTGSKAIGAVCNILCDVVGIEEFIKLIDKADLDPIYFCELLKTCPINDNGDAHVTVFNVVPKTGPQGVFNIALTYESKNGTGTGEIVIDIETVDKIPVSTAFLNELKPKGIYNVPVELKAEPDPDCDPTQGPCEQWLPGQYTVKVAVCNGECGSKHPHSQIYDEKSTTFTITE
ncbi:hypothetical protein CHS0354_029466 [Potamilus streckersoni]|uniref:Saposin B-type domain-containing protein n=1 Tax=Potamilus streckersoni TaxID=2493646 RepID=A0AAE0W1P8_9BIVA|nr:hypothetical protein CHS0354_029466 [Potamilus streckersoni]